MCNDPQDSGGSACGPNTVHAQSIDPFSSTASVGLWHQEQAPTFSRCSFQRLPQGAETLSSPCETHISSHRRCCGACFGGCVCLLLPARRSADGCRERVRQGRGGRGHRGLGPCDCQRQSFVSKSRRQRVLQEQGQESVRVRGTGPARSQTSQRPNGRHTRPETLLKLHTCKLRGCVSLPYQTTLNSEQWFALHYTKHRSALVPYNRLLSSWSLS